MKVIEMNSVNHGDSETSLSEFASAYMDSIFSIALALNNSIPALAKVNMSL